MRRTLLAMLAAACVLLVLPTTQAAIDEEYFLSKCRCASPDANPKCNFNKVSKKNLRTFIDMLVYGTLGCSFEDGKPVPKILRLTRMPADAAAAMAAQQGNALSAAQAQALASSTRPGRSASHATEVHGDGREVKAYSKDSKQQMANSAVTTMGCTMEGMMCTNTVNNVQFVFPTPILVTNLIRDRTAYDHNQALKELMLDLEGDDEGCKFNLHGGYRSQDGFMQRSEPAIAWLRAQIVPYVQQMLDQAGARDLRFRIDGWGAVLRGGHAQSQHVHPGAMYAGVYYITAPAYVAKEGHSAGCLLFNDPRGGANMAQIVRGRNIYGENFELCPDEKGGVMIIFPSWLPHEVKPMHDNTTEPRIAISFNIMFVP